MKWIHFFLRKTAVDRELESEIRFHLESVIQEKIAAGLSPAAARREALVEFGGREQIKEECRYVHRAVTVENTIANLKSAIRFIRRSPGFSIIVILTLALASAQTARSSLPSTPFFCVRCLSQCGPVGGSASIQPNLESSRGFSRAHPPQRVGPDELYVPGHQRLLP